MPVRSTNSNKWQLGMKLAYRPGNRQGCDIPVPDLLGVDTSKGFKVILRRRENSLGLRTFLNCTKTNLQPKWRYEMTLNVYISTDPNPTGRLRRRTLPNLTGHLQIWAVPNPGKINTQGKTGSSKLRRRDRRTRRMSAHSCAGFTTKYSRFIYRGICEALEPCCLMMVKYLKS